MRCDVGTDKLLKGVVIRIVETNARGSDIRTTSIVYTPELARQVARDIEIEAAKIDATGGPSEELKRLCGWVRERGGGS